MSKLLKHPIEIDIHAKELKDGRWELKYREKFEPEDLQAFKNAVEIIKGPHFPVTLDKTGSQISMHICTTREHIFNMLAGEFLLNSTFRDTTMGDLFRLSVLGISKDK